MTADLAFLEKLSQILLPSFPLRSHSADGSTVAIDRVPPYFAFSRSYQVSAWYGGLPAQSVGNSAGNYSG